MTADHVAARNAARRMDWAQLDRLVRRLMPEMWLAVAAARQRAESPVPDIEIPTWTGLASREAIPPGASFRVGIEIRGEW